MVLAHKSRKRRGCVPERSSFGSQNPVAFWGRDRDKLNGRTVVAPRVSSGILVDSMLLGSFRRKFGRVLRE